ncbi:MAG: HAMP domain-containing protein [Telmatospirillum sp.]|nr:HAMP domain-containing protein [Telmatospirillum sp.]
MRRQIDDTVSSELAEIVANAPGAHVSETAHLVDDLTRRSPDFFYLLQAGDGTVLAGNLPPMPPEIGRREWMRAVSDPHDQARIIRGEGRRLPDGGYLFVGLSTYQLREMQEAIRRAFFWGIAATVLLSLAGGAVMSLNVLGRVEALSRASRDIVGGDLTGRIPLSGSNDEFDHLATSLNGMLDRIEGLMEGLRQVSSDIAHDLRTPLTRLRQRVERALRKETSVRSLQEALAGTLRDVDSILETFGALLRIAQIESSARRANFDTVDLTEVLKTAVEVYASMAEDKGQTIAEAIPPGLVVHGDRELLLQLFANLLENAVRHTPRSTEIDVSATAASGLIDVVVADNGPGIPEHLRTRVFRRFYRLDASRTTVGSGLGLSLAAAVASLHDSAITLEDNRPGLRATIRLVQNAGT